MTRRSSVSHSTLYSRVSMDKPVDKMGRLEEAPFTYQITKEMDVLIYFDAKLVTTLRKDLAMSFIQEIQGLDELEIQLELARITGNFKRGNERYP